MVQVLYKSLDHLNESIFLQMVPKPVFRIQADKVVPKVAAPKVPSGEKLLDRSGQDWQSVCTFWEQHPQATMEEAREYMRGRWQATRQHQHYYETLTLEKAKKHCQGTHG